MFHRITPLCLILCILFLSRTALHHPLEGQEKPGSVKDPSGSNALEENDNDPPVYIMVPVDGERSRRGIEDSNNINLENASYEVPTFIKFNESAKGDIEVSLIPNNEIQQQQAVPQNGNGMGNLCPPMNGNNSNNKIMAPICLTLSIDSIFPPGKKINVSNSTEFRGNGVVLRVKFTDARDDCKSAMCASELAGTGIDQGLKQRFDVQKKRKFSDEEEEEESATTQVIDQKSLQELIFKILTSNKLPTTTEEVVFLNNDKLSTEPTYSFLINPSILNKITGKHAEIVNQRIIPIKSENSPDFDSLLKTVEHITSTMPKEKLLSLLSSLINKATLNKEMSTNQ